MRLLLYSTGKPFTQPQTGGNRRFVELAEYLCNHTDTELCCGDELENVGELKQFVKYRFNANPKIKSFLPPEAKKLSANKKLIEEIKQENFDAVITFDVPPTIGLCLKGIKNIVLMIRKDLIGYEKSTHPTNNIRNITKRLYLWLCESICLRRATCIIVQCMYDKNVLLSRHKILKKNLIPKIFVQINNVNPSWVETDTIKPDDREKVLSAQSKFTIGFIGNFNDSRKGHQILLPVAKKITGQNRNIFFEIIGGGKSLERFKKEYETSNIIFRGHIKKPKEIYQRCNLIVVPSLADSCPNTVIEPMYYGISVIGSKRGGIPEILEGCKNALFDLDEESLYTLILDLYTNPMKLRNLEQEEQRRKEELTFDWAEKINEIILHAT